MRIRPSDLFAQRTWGTVDINRLVRLIAISRKYEFEDFRDWSWNLLHKHITGNPGELLPRCGWQHLERLLNLCYDCQQPQLAQHIEKEWIDRIQTSGVGASCAALEAALDTAERSSYLRHFHGRAYYAYLKAVGAFQPGPALKIGETMGQAGISLSSFNDQRKLRLVQGFWSLVQLRLRLIAAPEIDPNPSCSHHTGECAPGWNGWWKETTEGIKTPSCDPSEFLQEIEKRLPRSGSLFVSNRAARAIYVYCSATLRARVQQMSSTFLDNIADHFMIPP
ncbi:hypothetical protein P691DRAFT_757611 [Macrolepiota fuliginosa MF-IS2]|uniref:Uncharacterized protein n=1 Tax=Macrolepiota fuliginosa MF-IS2 TaxID=1400762 RepID=A0A9P5XJZ7_9AGAR|nr:hypothetical protein P691DRAFT_757611 [Macrolepiota fuliginosa MF-IS2]